ncbi:MAG: DUF3313 domain-containing protein [Gammaproteobacteria bacterium]|nr:DUF3313 domain-containing protein [Gammaproteobacteria bacterium]
MKKILSLILLSSLLLTGCASNKVTEDKYSGFLNDYSILKTAPKDKETLAYVTPGIDWKKYNSVMIDKVLIITPDGKSKTDGKLLVAIADKFEEIIKQKVGKKFTVVDHAGEGTVRFQSAITSVFSSHDDMKGYQFIPVAAAVTGVTRASGLSKQNVRVMAEFRMVDSINGQLLGQAVDLKAGKEKEDKDSGILLADVVPILEQWAQRFTDRLDSLRTKVKQ